MTFYNTVTVNDINNMSEEAKKYHSGRMITYIVDKGSVKWERSGAIMHNMGDKTWAELRSRVGFKDVPETYDIVCLLENMQQLHVTADDMEISAVRVLDAAYELRRTVAMEWPQETIDGVRRMADAANSAYHTAEMMVGLAELADVMTAIDAVIASEGICRAAKEGQEVDALRCMRGLYTAASHILRISIKEDSAIIGAVIGAVADRAEETRSALHKVDSMLAASVAAAAADYAGAVSLCMYHIL